MARAERVRARAQVSVNFRKFSPCIARARRARAGLTVYPLSRPRFIVRLRAEVSKWFYSPKAKGSNVRYFLAAKNTVWSVVPAASSPLFYSKTIVYIGKSHISPYGAIVSAPAVHFGAPMHLTTGVEPVEDSHAGQDGACGQGWWSSSEW
jgi:hypothetical protein